VGVHGADGFAGTLRLLLTPVDDEVERSQGAEEALPQVVLVVRVVDNAGRDKGMRDLEEDGRAAAEERDERRVADAADDAFRLEVAISARKPLRMRAAARISVTGPTSSHATKGAGAGDTTRRFDDLKGLWAPTPRRVRRSDTARSRAHN
jgi:hypothetical protein